MKPLQTLDHVMLWIARVFAAIMIVAGIGVSLPGSVPSFPALALVFLFYSVLIEACLWIPPNPISQALLVISSLLALVWIFVVFNSFDPGEMSTGDASFIDLLLCTVLVGSVSLTWSAVRRRAISLQSSLKPA